MSPDRFRLNLRYQSLKMPLPAAVGIGYRMDPDQMQLGFQVQLEWRVGAQLLLSSDPPEDWPAERKVPPTFVMAY